MNLVVSRWSGDNPTPTYVVEIERLVEELCITETVVGAGTTTAIRTHLKSELIKRGWSDQISLSAETDLQIFSRFDDLAFQVQLGNISRAAYDLLKLQYLYKSGRCKCAILVLPTRDAAMRVGSNIANYERISGELRLFKEVVTVPLFIAGIE